MQLKRVLVIGIGLIGGSFALALKKASLVETVLGNSRSQQTLDNAKSLGVVDQASSDLPAMLDQLEAGDLVFLAVPTLTIEKLLPQLKAALDKGVVVTDGASVKGHIYHALLAAYAEFPANFVLGHPIAGSEKSGVTAAKADLYENHRVIITPVAENNPDAVELVARLWQACGATVDRMTVEEHDLVLAATSHLPHVLAYALVDCLSRDEQSVDVFRFAAGGFRDFTRIAGSDTTMWHDIVLSNKNAVLQRMDEFTQTLTSLRKAIANEDSQAITESFDRARASREHFVKLFNELKQSS